MLDLLHKTYRYNPPTPPTPCISQSTATEPFRPASPPTLDRLPAFLVQAPLDALLLNSLANTLAADSASGTLSAHKFKQLCDVKVLITSLTGRGFQNEAIYNKSDSASIAINIGTELADFFRVAYGHTIRRKAQFSLDDQTLDRFLLKDKKGLVIWEDKGWSVYNNCSKKIEQLSTSVDGHSLAFRGREYGERAIIYKVFNYSL